MEPCLFRHGKWMSWEISKSILWASMEPCLFRHGKPPEDVDPLDVVDASMEPCLFRHGKDDYSTECEVVPICFNGAMSFQTW